MLLDLTTLALELVGDITETSNNADPQETEHLDQNHLVLVIELDHMRDRRRYMDTLRYTLI